MPTENSGKSRGTIIKVPDASPGLLFVNGEQKSFTLGGVWQSPVAPAPNMIVDVQLDASNSVVSITQVDFHQARKEQMSHAGARRAGTRQTRGGACEKRFRNISGANGNRRAGRDRAALDFVVFPSRGQHGSGNVAHVLGICLGSTSAA